MQAIFQPPVGYCQSFRDGIKECDATPEYTPVSYHKNNSKIRVTGTTTRETEGRQSSLEEIRAEEQINQMWEQFPELRKKVVDEASLKKENEEV